MIPVESASGQLFFSTVRIVATMADGTPSVGTAFYFNVLLDPEGTRACNLLVTNKHVINGAVSGEFVLHEASDASGDKPAGRTATVRVPKDFGAAWFRHPISDVDLCMLPVHSVKEVLNNNGRHLFSRAFKDTDIPSTAALAKLRGIEDVTMIGYPSGIWDSVHNMPIARRGVTAIHPSLRFMDKPIGIADIGSFQGSSGSPVMILNEGSYHEGTALVLGHRIMLLGVMFGLTQYTTPGEIKITNIPTTPGDGVTTRIPMHLSLYVHASELLVMKPMIEELVREGWRSSIRLDMEFKE
ncbi:MAG: trypsin-like peptidase domain-containing protein [Labilithrix sp.]|nr:trypsin-like peptidase domain-containing protein [Labilithrix sp.]